MRRIHFITCAFIEDNNTRRPNDFAVTIASIAGAGVFLYCSAHTCSSFVHLTGMFKCVRACVCVNASRSLSAVCQCGLSCA